MAAMAARPQGTVPATAANGKAASMSHERELRADVEILYASRRENNWWFWAKVRVS